MPGARRRKISHAIKGADKRRIKPQRQRPSLSSIARQVKSGTITRRQFTRLREQIKKAAAVRLRLKLDRQAAVEARDRFRPRASDRGKIVLIGAHGQRNPQEKGRKGIAAYVTRTGKTRLLKITHLARPFKPRRLREIELPLRKNLARKVKQFQQQRAKILASGIIRRPAPTEEARIVKAVAKTGLQGDAARRLEDFRLGPKGRGHGQVKSGGQWDFNDRVVNTIAKSVRKTIKAQEAQRQFIIRVMALMELPDGRREVIEFFVDIARNDRDAIALGGIENFVRYKFYAYMARELAFQGLVTLGSRNHIRRLSANQGKPEAAWVDRRGEAWSGKGLAVANILNLEWRIEQAG